MRYPALKGKAQAGARLGPGPSSAGVPEEKWSFKGKVDLVDIEVVVSSLSVKMGKNADWRF